MKSFTKELEILTISNTKFFEFKKHELEICDLTSFLNESYENITFKQRMFHIKNKLFEMNKCVCGNPGKWNKNKGYVCCSKKCSKEKEKNTLMINHGVENPMHIEKSKEKMIATNIEKYGSKSFLSSDFFESKVGYSNPMKSESIKSKRTNTIESIYGVNHTSKSDIVKTKISKTIKAKTKDLAIANKNSCIKKYGTTNAMKSDIIKNKLKQDFIDNFIINDNYRLIGKNTNYYKIVHKICNNGFDVNVLTYKHRINNNVEICPHCNPLNNKWSSIENEIFTYIQSISNDITIIRNSRNIIRNLEIDLYLPQFNLAIEFNGLYWHSEIYKERNYHQNKWKLCNEQNLRLIQIWEHDWIYKQDNIKSLLCSILKQNKKIGARKCKLTKINVNTERNFLNKYHLQGYSPSSIAYGLLSENGDLLQMMSFKKSKDKFEIERLCTQPGISIMGGANKLLKQFIVDFKPKHIFTYSSNDYFTGKVYEKLGFKLIKITEPNYLYFKSITDILSREQCMKAKLVKAGFDNEKTERQIMKERKFTRVYNSGNKLFDIKINS